MANIQLPGTGLVKGYDVGSQGSMAAAAAPWQALGGLGQVVQGLGEKASDFLVKQQRVKNVQLANEMELKANEEYAAFQRELATNQNPDSWTDQWSKRLEQIKSSHLSENLAPEQQALLGERFSGFASNTTIRIAEQATMKSIGMAKQAVGNRIDQAVRMNDPVGGMRAIDDGVAGGLYGSSEADSLRMNLRQKMETQQVEEDLTIDPLGVAAELKEKNEDGTWKNYTNLDPNQRNRLLDATNKAKRQVLGDAVDDAQNGMADGSITTPEQLERRVGGVVEPRIMERLKGDLAQRWDAKEIARRATPQYQEETVGKVSAMLTDFNAEMDDYDEKFVEMDSLVRSLPDGSAAKSELSRRLGQVRTGQTQEFQSIADLARGDFEALYKDRFFGDVVQRRPLRAAIDDGLLQDRDKLQKYGFDEDQAKTIATADEETERMALFRTLHVERKGKSSATPYEEAVFEAIRAGKGPSEEISWEDPAARISAQRRFGEMKIKFENWLKANPEKADDIDAVEKEKYRLISPEGMNQFQRNTLPEFPGTGFNGLPGVLPPR